MLKIGYIGLGGRGKNMLKTILDSFKNVEIAGVCDLRKERAQKGADMVKEVRGTFPFVTTDSNDIMNMDVDAVMVMTGWEAHIPLCIDAMNHGKPVSVEVGGAYSIEDCFELVRTSEKTGVPCMLLENCCYGRYELALLNMVREGLFGDVVHCEGGYLHDLRREVSYGEVRGHYRQRNYKMRNGENYPTHELGPIAKFLNINRGNRMVKLNSISSRAAGLRDYADREADILYERLAEQGDEKQKIKIWSEEYELNEELCETYVKSNDCVYAQGDIVNTIITCADGSTISLTLDTTLPRPYSRGLSIRGTRGCYFEDNRSLYIDNEEMEKLHFNWKGQWGNADEFVNKYNHPIWQKYAEDAKASGHDGMDYMVLRAFFEAMENKKPFPIDVYDTASWMCITTLSEQSIAMGGAPVAIPDFTCGKWAMYKKKESDLEFSLD